MTTNTTRRQEAALSAYSVCSLGQESSGHHLLVSCSIFKWRSTSSTWWRALFSMQIAILSVLTGAFFWRGRRHRNTVTDGNIHPIDCHHWNCCSSVKLAGGIYSHDTWAEQSSTSLIRNVLNIRNSAAPNKAQRKSLLYTFCLTLLMLGNVGQYTCWT